MSEKVPEILAQYALECKLLVSLGCFLAASIYVFKWRRKQWIVSKMEVERRRREESVRRSQEAVETFHRQNPGLDDERIRGWSLLELTEKLQDGSLSPEHVLYAYTEKALQVNCDLNCVTTFLLDLEAQLKDLKEGEEKGHEKGPLYGVPISIKEHIGYQGHPSTCGLVQYLDDLEEEDSVIVKVLKKQGAVIFAKTNVPQNLLCYETSNPIYGHTLNPHNPTKGASGSSGGEGALIAGEGSVLGIGTDIGGSIRLPGSFCGICGFKPTASRLSIRGVRPCIDGMIAVPMCIGPMARDVDSLVLCMRALWCDEMFRLDPSIPPIYFNEEVYSTSKPLCIGYYEEDEYFQPNPAMRRVLLETKQLLEDAGHKLVPFKPPRMNDVYNLFWKLLLGDGGETTVEKFKDNIVDPNLEDSVRLCKMPVLMKQCLSILLCPIFPRISSAVYSALGARSVRGHWKDQAAQQEYQKEFFSEWRKQNLDVVLCPMLCPAFNVGYPGRLLGALSYTLLYNLLNCPAGVLPIGSVTVQDEEELKHYRGYSHDPWDKLYKKAVENGVGLPLSVQCVALPHQDEACLRLMKEIETLQHRHGK